MNFGWIVLKATFSLVILFSLVTALLCCFSFRFKNIVFGKLEWVGYLQIVFLLFSSMAVAAFGFDDTLVLIPQSWRISDYYGESMKSREYLAGFIGGWFAIASVALVVRLDNQWSGRIKFEAESRALRILLDNSILRQERRQFLLNKHTRIVEAGFEREEQLASKESQHLEFETSRHVRATLDAAEFSKTGDNELVVLTMICERLNHEFLNYAYGILASTKCAESFPLSLTGWEIIVRSDGPTRIHFVGQDDAGKELAVSCS